MNKSNKYNAKTVYFNRELNVSFPPEIGKDLPGFEKFDSEFELKVYKEILHYTFFVQRQQPFNLTASRLLIDFFLQHKLDNGQISFLAIEAKGYETSVWKLKYKEFKLLYPLIPIFIIRKTTDILKLRKVLNGKNFVSSLRNS